jgi:hypothetical protein
MQHTYEVFTREQYLGWIFWLTPMTKELFDVSHSDAEISQIVVSFLSFLFPALERQVGAFVAALPSSITSRSFQSAALGTACRESWQSAG